jgi:bifunctional non-homologous end joining protein LigD
VTPAAPAAARQATLRLPDGADRVELRHGARRVMLTNLRKPYWPDRRITKRDLLQYYADVAPVLLPHVAERAMVMKRYPDGIAGPFFFMKRVPVPHPSWVRTCAIRHASGDVIAFPVVEDLLSLLWIVNLGCIDLNPWYARCDDVDRPDYLHFDLDPTPGAAFEQIREAALLVRDACAARKMVSYAKTTGSRGLHVYVPIVRGPTQKQVWSVARAMAHELARTHAGLLTAEYRVAARPPRRVLVDYNQNAWGRTLASVYSVRPTPAATVSTPVTWDEVERGIRLEDFHIWSVRARITRVGDLWAPLAARRGRVTLRLPR